MKNIGAILAILGIIAYILYAFFALPILAFTSLTLMGLGLATYIIGVKKENCQYKRSISEEK